MKVYALSERHSSYWSCCAICGKGLGSKRKASLLVVIADDGQRFEVKGCRPCWKALAEKASP